MNMITQDGFLNLGAAPINEKSADPGSFDYASRSLYECTAYIRQLRRLFGPEPEGSRFRIDTTVHDFGARRQVVYYYTTQAGVDYAIRCKNDGPQTWDEIAKSELA